MYKAQHFSLFLLLIIGLFQGCAHSPSNKRILAGTSSDAKTCLELAHQIWLDEIPDNLDKDLIFYLQREGKRYWKKHNAQRWKTDPRRLLTPLKEKLTRIFKNWNANALPVLYIDDLEETLILVTKYEEIFKQNLRYEDLDFQQKDIWDRVEKIFSRVVNYPTRMNNNLREYLALEYAIRHLKRKNRQTPARKYPITTEFTEIVNGKIEVNPKNFAEPEDLIFYVQILEGRRDELNSQQWFKKGQMKEDEIQQAKDLRRLKFIHTRLNNLQLKNTRNNITPTADFVKKLELTGEILRNENLQASPKIVIKLVTKEFLKEMRDLFNTIENHELLRKAHELYQTLTPREKRLLKLDDHGASGRVMTIVQKNPWFVLGSALLSGSGTTTVYLTLLKDAFKSDFDKRYDCVEMTEDDAFFYCMETYLEEKFILQHPLSFILNNYAGLVKALKNNPDQVQEFKLQVDLLQAERAEKMKNDNLREEFRKTFFDELREIVRRDLNTPVADQPPNTVHLPQTPLSPSRQPSPSRRFQPTSPNSPTTTPFKPYNPQ